MILSVMAFLATVSAVASAAAWLADEGLRRAGVPTRFLWLVALWAPAVALLAPLLLREAPAPLARAMDAAPVVELAPLVVGGSDGALGAILDASLGVAWVVTALGLVLTLLITHRRLARERTGWQRSEVEGREVFLSDDRGPAVAGVLRPWIVLPRWSLALPRKELRLVLMHEEEHLRTRDTLLLAGALGLVVLTPWNPVAWWSLKRLRTAMEVDCDRRVLTQEPDAERYGASLLTIASRSSGLSLGLASFTQRSVSLKQRILAMTASPSRWTPLRAGLFTALALLVGVQACGFESPMETLPPRAEAVVDAPAAAEGEDLASRPIFTPFTVAPSIRNRSEVVQAMSDAYPPLLRDAGIGGTVRVFFFIGEDGKVRDTRIDESSGHVALDDAAIQVASVYDFTPALNRDQAVPVWVSFPITFQSSSSAN